MKAVRAILIAALAAIGAAGSAAAQFSALGESVPFPVADVPFGPGEQMVYKVTWGVFGSVGQGVLDVVGIDTIRGRPTYHLRFRTAGNVMFFKVDDNTQSWLDVENLAALRFDQNLHEVNYKAHRVYDFFPDSMRWARQGHPDDTGELLSPEPLDDVSFLYFVRTLPLEVGETYTYNRYWRDRGNPVTVKVLRKDSAKVDGVYIPTIVVKPIIKTKGAFSEDGEAEVHFSDDSQRLIVYLKASMAIGSLKMYLERYTPGTKLRYDPPKSEEGDAS